MKKLAFAAVIAAVAFTAGPLSVGVAPAKAQNLQVAQVDVQVGRDRDDHRYRDRDDYRHRRDFTIGFGEREHCRTVVTRIERYGRTIVKRERRCD